MGKSLALTPDCKYYLLPSSWLLKWRNYINASGKNVASSVKPEILDGAIDLLKCEKVACILYLAIPFVIRFAVTWIIVSISCYLKVMWIPFKSSGN